jgi:hypothetical protein
VRGTGTWIVVAAVLGLGLVATVDAFRDESEAPPAAPSTQPDEPPGADERSIASRLLREQSIRGTLTYLDEGCELRSVALPDLEERPVSIAPTVVVSPPGESSCRFSLSRGTAFGIGPAVPAPRAGLVAGCADGQVTVTTRTRILVGRARGCAPAWKPDGVLTAVSGGEVVELAIAGGGGVAELKPRVLLSRDDLRRALSRAPWALPDPVVREVAWLRNDLAAVVARDRAVSDHVVALFRGSRLVGAPNSPYPPLSDLRVSPFGRFVAARIGGGPGMLMLDETGDLVSVGIRTARAVAWSPDEAWTALATSDGVFVFQTGERAISLIRLPIAARDLVWR